MKINSDIAIALGEVQALAFLTNLHTDYAVFTDFSGHVTLFKIRIRASKQDYKTRITTDEFYLHKGEATLKRLKILKLRLKKILRDKEVNYNDLDYTIREVRDYHLGGTN